MTPEIRKMFFKELLDQNIIQSCLNCEHWNSHKEKCDKFQDTPPSQIIVFSCGKDWKANVPF